MRTSIGSALRVLFAAGALCWLVADFTYLRCWEGLVFFAFVIDAFSRRVVGWQFAGHHVSLNFTVVDGRYVSPTPCMLGSQPASFGMLAPLADDEELGFRLVNSLDAGQRHAAIIHHRPPPDLAARMVPKIGETERPDRVALATMQYPAEVLIPVFTPLAPE